MKTGTVLDVAPLPETTEPLIRRVCGLLTPGGEQANLLVAQRDEMLHDSVRLTGDPGAGLVHYFASGASMADAIRQLSTPYFANLGAVRLLDFAAGHGRMTRFLLHAAPDVTVADIKEDAVRFQQQAFGVRGAVSVESPRGFLKGEQFDLITVTSLFTHLPKPAWQAWLEHLIALLSPRGLLIFSTRGNDDQPPHGFDHDGFCFEPTSESKELDARNYGTTWATQEFITKAVRRLSAHAIVRVPGGLLRYQDLYVLAPRGVDGRAFLVHHGPRGWVDDLTNDQRMVITGWAVDEDLKGAPEAVAIFCGDESVGATRTFTQRDDVAAALGIPPIPCAWRIETAPRRVGDPLVVVSHGRDGRASVLRVTTTPA